MIGANAPNRPRKGILLTAIGLIVAVAILAVTTVAGLVAHDSAARYIAILFGAIMAVAGNALPKYSTPPPGGGQQSVVIGERLTGWVFAVGGLTIAGLWMFLPDDAATFGAPFASLCVLSLCLIALFSLAILSRSAWQDRTLSEFTRQRATMRRAVYQILHGLIWAMAILSTASWGNQIAAWLIVPFTTGMGILDVILTPPRRHDVEPDKFSKFLR